jgi:hypothetical protein
MQYTPSRTAALLAVLGLATTGASAGDVRTDFDTGRFTFDAFGTLGVVHSDETHADFNRSALSPQGAGASESWSPAVDSVLAGQVSAQVTPRISATVQVVAELRYDSTYRPFVEWAYVGWEVTPDLAVRFGRTSTPTFAITDTRRLGYAQHWVRAPGEVYDLIPVTSNDGIDVVWHAHAFGVSHILQAAYGRSESKSTPRGMPAVGSTSDQQLTVRYSVERGALGAYVNYGRDRLSVGGFEALTDGFASFGPQGQAIARRYGTLDKRGTFYGLGATYDAGRWFAMGEWARVENPSMLGTRTGRYLSGGMRFAAFTPYLIVSDADVNSATADPGLDLSLLPPQAVPAAAGLNAALNGILASTADYSTFAQGLRWDFAPNLSLKLQHERIRIADGSWGPLTRIQPGFQPGGTVRVVSVAVSFVL